LGGRLPGVKMCVEQDRPAANGGASNRFDGLFQSGGSAPTLIETSVGATNRCGNSGVKPIRRFRTESSTDRPPIGRAYAAARVNKIYGGTSEIMKEIISRSL
jgi:alkylation response protein AidB-like acyl-CoA dehydrogenase